MGRIPRALRRALRPAIGGEALTQDDRVALVPAAIVAATVASYAIGWAAGIPWLVPILNTLASYPFMVAALRGGQLRVAMGRMLVWAIAMGACATVLAWMRPWDAGRLFLTGSAYRAEMFEWVMTGRGVESSPSQFIPQHARHAALFVVLALASGGALAMPMGAVLMNYMGTYVGSLAAASAHPLRTVILGWHPWAVIRIVSFVVLGVVLSVPLLSKLFRFQVDRADARRLLILAIAGLLADVLLKAVLAPTWQRMLLRAVGW